MDDYRAVLRALDEQEWPGYLTDHSGLPGPRGNIELGQAVADEASPECLDALIATDDEYLVFCGVVGLGRLLAERQAGTVVQRLRSHAGDPRWRVREAVAMALQRLGDRDLPRLLDLAADMGSRREPAGPARRGRGPVRAAAAPEPRGRLGRGRRLRPGNPGARGAAAGGPPRRGRPSPPQGPWLLLERRRCRRPGPRTAEVPGPGLVRRSRCRLDRPREQPEGAAGQAALADSRMCRHTRPAARSTASASAVTHGFIRVALAPPQST